jgi:hypothetical protein
VRGASLFDGCARRDAAGGQLENHELDAVASAPAPHQPRDRRRVLGGQLPLHLPSPRRHVSSGFRVISRPWPPAFLDSWLWKPPAWAERSPSQRPSESGRSRLSSSREAHRGGSCRGCVPGSTPPPRTLARRSLHGEGRVRHRRGGDLRRDFEQGRRGAAGGRCGGRWIRRAGSILLGKTNVPPGGSGGVTDNPVHGRTNNLLFDREALRFTRRFRPC